jgi:ribonuclease HI
VVSILSLDVSGAFDNVSHLRLIHNLRKRKIDWRVAGWVASFLQNRRTTIRLPEGKSELMSVETGIPQGSPLSLMLYLFFNADLIEDCQDPNLNAEAVGWVDDGNIITWGATTEENCRNLEATYEKCKAWETKHASKFNPSKFSLIHLPSAYMKNINMDSPVQLDGQKVKPVTKCRILGLILDSKLSWDSHIECIEAKTTRSLGALGSLAGSTWGTSYKGLRQIYQATILPQITYAASIWYAPTSAGVQHRRRAIRKLEAVQRKAARIITGAYRTVSGPALDVEAYLLPLQLHLDKITAETYLRIRASPLHQTLQQIQTQGRWKGYQNDWKDLHNRWGPLERHKHRCETILGPEAIHSLEQKQPFLTPTWWEAPNTWIEDTMERATNTHDQILERNDSLVFYTDGSAINEKVGAATIQHNPRKTQQAFLGRKTEASVFMAELVGIQMALEMAQFLDNQKVTIFSDSQAAIQAIDGPHTTGQQIISSIIQEWDKLRSRGVHVAIHWIPAHQGIEGNELADKAAKEATGWRLTRNTRGRNVQIDTDFTAPRLEGLRQPMSALKRKLKTRAYEQWERNWHQDTRGRALFQIINTPTKKTTEIHTNLDKALSSIRS